MSETVPNRQRPVAPDLSEKLVLASASPRRRALLETLCRGALIDPADLDESLRPGESPEDYVRRIALAKAETVAARHPGRFSLGADTTVVVDGVVLGKPADAGQARDMLKRLSNRTHSVLSAVVLAAADRHSAIAVVETTVRFDRLPGAWIDDYVASAEPLDKAGGYAIQGCAAAWIASIHGSYSGVVGLPLYETAKLLRAAGLI